MKSKLRILLMTALCLACLFAFSACGSGVQIGENGNWYIDGEDTGVSASGASVAIGPDGHWYIDGEDTGVSATAPSGAPVEIGDNGNWFVGGEDTGVSAVGEDGSVVTVGGNGHWYIDGEDTGISAGGSAYDPQGLEFCPLADGSYAVAIGSARYLREIEVPASFNGRPVTAVGEGGFAGAPSLERIALPEGLTCVGASAFAGCENLVEVVLPATLEEIGGAAFENCAALAEVALPAALQGIGASAFAGCDSLARAAFAQPEGWAVEAAGGPVSLSGTDLASGVIAAQMLTDTRCDYLWSKPVSAEEGQTQDFSANS